MSTKIEWTEVTWNPTTGCNKISAGCKNCYAEVMHKRLQGMGQPKYQTDFNKGVKTWEDELMKPLSWKKPRKVFVNSMSDLFHEDVPFEFIDKVFTVMALTPQHTYQILTKRADRMEEYFALHPQPRIVVIAIHNGRRLKVNEDYYNNGITWPLPNVWLGTSVENQQTANKRIPHLLRVPAAVRFLSCEPLLGRVDLNNIPFSTDEVGPFTINALTGFSFQTDIIKWPGCEGKIDWVIAGGESGHGARPMHPDWVRSLRNQCHNTGVAFFFKQWGEWLPIDHLSEDDYWKSTKSAEVGTGVSTNTVFKLGKKAAGRVLDGREWNDWPKLTKTH